MIEVEGAKKVLRLELTDLQLNTAFLIWQQLGPEGLIPVEERWTKRLPSLESDACKRMKLYRELKILFNEIRNYSFVLGRKVWDGKMTIDDARLQLGRKYPK